MMLMGTRLVAARALELRGRWPYPPGRWAGVYCYFKAWNLVSSNRNFGAFAEKSKTGRAAKLTIIFFGQLRSLLLANGLKNLVETHLMRPLIRGYLQSDF